MPDLEPVSGDPFSTQLEPVSGDPFTAGWGEEPQRLIPKNTFAERWPSPTDPFPSPLDLPHGNDEVMGWWKYLPKQTQQEIDAAKRRHFEDMQYQLFKERGFNAIESDFDPPRIRPSLLHKVSDESDMTHSPDQPAQPYMHPNVPGAARAVAGFAAGGLHGAGAPLPDWAASNPVQRAVQNPDNAAAMGMARNFGNPKLTASQIEEIGQHLKSGLTAPEIAAKYNTTPSAIQYQRVKAGMSEPRQPVPSYDKELAAGMTHKQIAEKYGIPSSTVSNRIARSGGPPQERATSAKRGPSLPNVRLEPVEHNPFSLEDERIFGYRE